MSMASQQALDRDDVLKILQTWQRMVESHPQATADAVCRGSGVPCTAQASPAIPQTSLIVAGYANALFRLGAYYENSLSSHNADEAVRCYLKAARLGNAEALSRLAPRCAD